MLVEGANSSIARNRTGGPDLGGFGICIGTNQMECVSNISHYVADSLRY